MAVRKRSETIHLRTTPFVRSTLDVLAALNGKTATAVIEDLLSLAISETELPAPNFIQEKKIVNGRINLKELMESIYTDNALLFKLRLFILVPDAVSEDDKIMCEIILEDLARPASIFRGEEKIFDEKCGGCKVKAAAKYRYANTWKLGKRSKTVCGLYKEKSRYRN